MNKWFKNFFIPHEGNNHHPHFWRNTSIGVFVAVIVLVEVAVLSQSFIVMKFDSFLASILPAVVTNLTNEERQNQNLNTLKVNPVLEQAARLKAQDMATRGYFAHNTPEGYLPWYWLQKVGYNYAHAGENLAVNFTDSEDVVDAWMKSPTHRANIVKNNYSEIGIGMAEGTYKGKSAIFVVQFFGTPVVAATPTVTPAPVVTQAPVDPIRVVSTPDEITVLGAESAEVVPAKTAEKVEKAESQVIKNLLASPRTTGEYILYTLMSFLAIVFLMAIFIKIKVQHPRIIAIGLVLILIIVGITMFNSSLMKDSVIVSLSVI